MKLKWKIGIGVTVLFATLMFMSSFIYLNTGAVRKTMVPSSDPKSPSNVDRRLDEMEFAAIAFNAPTNINIDDSSQIQLILSLAETVEQLKQSIAEEGEKVGATIKVSDKMEARLSGYMFQITAITSEIQAVTKHQQTEWNWEIHPKEEGQHRLHLTLTGFIEIDGNSTPRAIRTFSNVIEVNVTASQKVGIFLKNNWQWLWAAILVPVAGWLWKRKKKQLTNTSSCQQKAARLVPRRSVFCCR